MANIRYPKYQLRVNNPDAISSIDVLESIQSQYAASPHLLALLVKKAAIADPGRDLMKFYMGIFNPQTAQGIGLDIWGRIVGVSRVIEVEVTRWFGFTQGRLQPFGQAPFWRGVRSYVTQDLDDEDYRVLVFWKAAANIASAEAPALNNLLQRLFPGKQCFVLEIRPMHIRVVTRVGISAIHKAIFRRYGLIAKGAGVGVSWLDVPPKTFGFAGTGLLPFGNGESGSRQSGGPFFAGNIVDYQPSN